MYEHKFQTDEDRFWRNLKYATSANFNLISSKENHAYSLLEVFEFEEKNENVKIIRLRNPWGKRKNDEWTGAWSTSSTKWTPGLR